jgi:putative transposase
VVLQRVLQQGKAVRRVHTIWVDAGFDGNPFMRWVITVCRWLVQVVLRPKQTQGW